ncbi:glutathione S-transferase family protein [Desertifilum sp. FACHB-1129]|uniref:Glutathione S-transferase n=1 Tax=Desertifilum tharense IPPAS B-1220 TaxID=1781255 RepID=A0A1E5QCV7_9CYAN|nr:MULTISPECIES: glutathione S-transferase family protein [Desertifilum]MCD8489945.1 glutathione S-transferase family protein [Desertifilum sp.]MDA0209480.1 glutathione S-transferase family protein [Cyanobacteria bacterium FC1]MBD2315206.1 glutathione S-transferase family protein [Desertifilum sp. FACHB-1129]MBD2321060.1 glutathione S-transferase family protein [Desertifilum sp. FACHB-866]MBD2331189.1 glutathione S-transferase family protein [Desertifilum sp. FACHB-868]
MLKLYGGPGTRGTIVQWYLEELGVPYESVAVNLRAGEQQQPEFLAINPMGKVPAIADGDFKLWESGAILLYLAEKHGDLPEDLETRSQVLQWVMFANATLGPAIVGEASRDRAMTQLFGPLNQMLEQQPFLLGDRFSVADVALGALLAFFPIMLKIDYSDYPAIGNYVKRLSERPAFANTVGKR